MHARRMHRDRSREVTPVAQGGKIELNLVPDSSLSFGAQDTPRHSSIPPGHLYRDQHIASNASSLGSTVFTDDGDERCLPPILPDQLVAPLLPAPPALRRRWRGGRPLPRPAPALTVQVLRWRSGGPRPGGADGARKGGGGGKRWRQRW